MIILDTHAWIWWVSAADRLSPRARESIEYAGEVGVCSISIWEIATKVSKKRLRLDRELEVWVRQALARPGLELLPLSAEIALTAGRLGEQGLHGDPADRLIVATAMESGAQLVTKDKKLRQFPAVKSLW